MNLSICKHCGKKRARHSIFEECSGDIKNGVTYFEPVERAKQEDTEPAVPLYDGLRQAIIVSVMGRVMNKSTIDGVANLCLQVVERHLATKDEEIEILRKALKHIASDTGRMAASSQTQVECHTRIATEALTATN